MTEYKTDTGMIYAVRQQPEGGWRIMCRYPGAGWALTTDPRLSAECGCAESLQEVLDAYAPRRGWAVYDPPEASPTFSAAATAAAEEPASPPAEQAPANTTAEPAAGGSEPEENALAANPATSDLSQPAAFDYSGLDAKTIDTMHLAEREILDAKQVYVVRMSNAVAMVHDVLVQNLDGHNQHSETTFIAWCRFVGISKSTAYNLLQVNRLLSGASPEEMVTLKAASPSLLYAGAKPSADPEMVQDLKDGKISTLKEWNQREAELKSQLKAKDDELAAVKAEAALDRKEQEDANAAAQRYKAEADRRAQDQQRLEGRIKGLEDSYRSAHANEEFAIRRAADAEQKATRFAQIKDAALDQVKQAQAKLEAERSDSRRAAAQLQQRIRELETRPVEVVAADPDEVNRLAEEKAQAIAAQRSADSTRDRDALQQRIEELEELLDDAAQDQIANTQALAVQAVEACEGLLGALFGHILMLPDPQYLPAKRIVESFYAKLGWVLDNNDWPDEDNWALNYSGDESDDEPDEEEAEEDE